MAEIEELLSKDKRYEESSKLSLHLIYHFSFTIFKK